MLAWPAELDIRSSLLHPPRKREPGDLGVGDLGVTGTSEFRVGVRGLPTALAAYLNQKQSLTPPKQYGSGDIHAFGDSNLYLRRIREHLVLSSEHRGTARIGAGLSGSGRDPRGDDPPGGHRGAPGREATRSRRAGPRPSGPGHGVDASEAPRFAGGPE